MFICMCVGGSTAKEIYFERWHIFEVIEKIHFFILFFVGDFIFFYLVSNNRGIVKYTLGPFSTDIFLQKQFSL